MEPRRMNSAVGKSVLAIARGGDYAHPGGAGVVEHLIKGLTIDPNHCVLDAGCGRGGTANLLQSLTKSKVFGIDLDEVSIEYAQETYPDSAFSVCDVTDCHSHFNLTFDLITAFSVFYSLTIDQQLKAMQEFYALTASHAHLVLFDYTTSIFLPAHDKHYRHSWQPLVTETMEELSEKSGWRIDTFVDYSDEFEKWYAQLVASIDAKQQEIVDAAGGDWFEFALSYYSKLYEDVSTGEIGGGAYHLKRLS